MKKLVHVFTVFILQLIFVFPLISSTVVVKSGKESHVNLVVKNVCSYYGIITLCNGNDSLGVHASVGSIGGWASHSYLLFDSLFSFSKIKFLDIDPSGIGHWQKKYLYVGDESKIQKFYVSYSFSASPMDSIYAQPKQFFYMDSMAAFNAAGGVNYILKSSSNSNNYFVYDSTLNTQIAALQLNMKPEMMYDTYQYRFVSGKDFNSRTSVAIVSNSLVVQDTVLPSFADNVKHMTLSLQTLILVCAPGDSVINIVKYNYVNGTISVFNLLSTSGVKASELLDNNLIYQPDTDVAGNNDDKKLFEFDLQNLAPLGVYAINKRIKRMKYPVNPNSFGYYPYLNIIEESTNPTKVYEYSKFNFLLADSFSTAYNPDFFVGDFRCPFTNIKDYDDSNVKFETYPNPAGHTVTIESSGLICGRDYKMDIVDTEGKIKFKSVIHSKMTLSLPVENFSPGMYFIRIHTLKGAIVQKLIKE